MGTAPTWTESDGSLSRVFQFADFVEAFGFVTRVALLAQRQDHHPDITISWNTVTITSTSHDANGTVTDRDRKLTESIDTLL